ncbi:hypothetical protein DSM104299_05110 [Baekduia alba]|uniref:hypothetical protein n=1 Tax=Baekduia alba TaxID=2997333 RepID=UPI002341ACFA|nr:hypothetical protein [Baekduia alba]WCB96353.1 hypothetical protein DSM104299_05110 [Baekduia alba]
MYSSLRRRATLSLLVGLVCLIGAAQAQASADGPTLCLTGSPACVWFTNNGDVIHVRDGACDGYSAVAQIQVPSAGIYNYLWNNDGCGTTRTYSYGTAVPEGAIVYYRPCIGDGNAGVVLRCTTPYAHGIA